MKCNLKESFFRILLYIDYIMKLKPVHLLVILILALLICSIFSCKMIEGLTNKRLSEMGQPPPLPSGGMNPNSTSDLNTFQFGVSGLENAIGQNYFDLNKPNMPQGPMGATSDTLSGQNAASASAEYWPNQGIPASQIPNGQEDLYILKSSVVPPVCPACPQSTECPREKPCPACPPCGRCPEPAFECKKVPNYSADRDYGSIQGGSFLPMPVLSDFSQFGM